MMGHKNYTSENKVFYSTSGPHTFFHLKWENMVSREIALKSFFMFLYLKTAVNPILKDLGWKKNIVKLRYDLEPTAIKHCIVFTSVP